MGSVGFSPLKMLGWTFTTYDPLDEPLSIQYHPTIGHNIPSPSIITVLSQ